MPKAAEQAIDALSRRDLRGAMTHGLAWWRDAPAPALAELLETLEAVTPAEQRDGFSTRLEKVIAGGNSVKSRANVEALAKTPADPRLTRFLIKTLTEPSFDLSSGNPERLAQSAAELLVKQPDPRVRTFLDELDARLQARAGTRSGQLSRDEIATLTRIFRALKPIAPPRFTETDVARFSAALEPLLKDKRSSKDERERLLTGVIAHFDDAQVQVYGDWLAERGDAQGELIARMLAGETKELESLKLKARAACFAGAELTWERGLPVKALFANRDGVRTSTWGTELEWGTIRETDLVPKNGCHAERLETLHVGSSYVKDLAQRTEPLKVKNVCVLSLAPSGKSAWKKVSALSSVERLVVRRLELVSDLQWFLATPTGSSVKRVEFEFTDELPALITEARSTFRDAPTLESIAMPTASLTRRKGALELSLFIENEERLQRLLKILAQVPRPACDTVVLTGPAKLTTSPELQSLGSRVTTSDDTSAIKAKVATERQGDLLVLTPKDGTILDFALDAFLEDAPPRLEIACGVDFRQTSALWAQAQARGVVELTLRRKYSERHVERGQHAWWYGAPFTLTLRPNELVCEARRGAAELLAAATGLPRVARANVTVSSGLEASERTQLETALRQLANTVTFTTADSVSELRAKYVKSRKRLEVTVANDAAALAPSVLDAVIAKHGAVESVQVFQRGLELKPWLPWIAEKKLSIEFRIPNQRPDEPVRLWWNNGVHASLTLRRDFEKTMPGVLLDLPARALESLELCTSSAPASAWSTAAKHVAKTATVSRPRG